MQRERPRTRESVDAAMYLAKPTLRPNGRFPSSILGGLIFAAIELLISRAVHVEERSSQGDVSLVSTDSIMNRNIFYIIGVIVVIIIVLKVLGIF